MTTSPEHTIRPLRPDDIESVMDIWERANALAHPFLAPDFVAEVRQAMRDIYLPNAETHVLETCGAVVGFLSLVGHDIGGLFIDPDCHRSGHGRALVDHARALRGALSVDVFRDNAIGRPFYAGYGFVLVKETLHAPSGQPVCTMALSDS